NPVAVLLNKVVLEYIPKYGQWLADEVRKWGRWVKEQAEQELAEVYPKDSAGATPLTYLWARTIKCEGPGCGAQVPLVRTTWLARRSRGGIAVRLRGVPEEHHVDLEILELSTTNSAFPGTVRLGTVTCPCCGFTTPNVAVRQQLLERSGGTADA